MKWRQAENIISVVLIVAVLALASISLFPFSNTRDLERAITLWEESEIDSYSYTILLVCFCDFPAGEKIEVTVKSNSFDVATIQNGDSKSEDELDGIPLSMEAVFEMIGKMYASQPQVLKVKYDERLGYPISIRLDGSVRTFDDEVSYNISEFRASK